MARTATCDREGCSASLTFKSAPNLRAIINEGWRVGPQDDLGHHATWCPEHALCEPAVGHHVIPHVGCILR